MQKIRVVQLESGRRVRKRVEESAGYEIMREEDEETDEIEELPENFERGARGEVICRLYLPDAYHRFIVGTKAATLRSIERETSTKLFIPKKTKPRATPSQIQAGDAAASVMKEEVGEEESDEAPKRGSARAAAANVSRGSIEPVVIRGDSVRGVKAAVRRCEAIVEEVTPKIPYTHFLCLPLRGACDAVEKVQQDIQYECREAEGLDRSIFNSPRQFHATLLMLRLLTEEDEEKARVAMERCGDEVRRILSGVVIRLKGLEIMNDDPSDVHVVFAKIEDGSDGAIENIERVWKILVDSLTEQGLVDEQELDRQRMRAGDGSFKPKLHATLINTKHRRPQAKKRIPLDATTILDKFKDVEIVREPASTVHLSIRGPFGPDGFYKALARI